MSWEPFGRTRREGPAPAPPRTLPREPARQLAVLTCMDCRIDPLGALGLKRGDAVVLRNAGAQWSEDVVRSLKLARGLGVRRVHVLAHTDCAAYHSDDEAALAGARRAAARIRADIPELQVEAGQLDVRTGAVVNRPAAARPPSG
jgi:carbonic anhydrase